MAGVRIGFLGFLESYGSYKYEYDCFADGERPGVARMDEATVRKAVQVKFDVGGGFGPRQEGSRLVMGGIRIYSDE